jgi:hypothetical protein
MTGRERPGTKDAGRDKETTPSGSSRIVQSPKQRRKQRLNAASPLASVTVQSWRVRGGRLEDHGAATQGVVESRLRRIAQSSSAGVNVNRSPARTHR